MAAGKLSLALPSHQVGAPARSQGRTLAPPHRPHLCPAPAAARCSAGRAPGQQTRRGSALRRAGRPGLPAGTATRHSSRVPRVRHQHPISSLLARHRGGALSSPPSIHHPSPQRVPAESSDAALSGSRTPPGSRRAPCRDGAGAGGWALVAARSCQQGQSRLRCRHTSCPSAPQAAYLPTHPYPSPTHRFPSSTSCRFSSRQHWLRLCPNDPQLKHLRRGGARRQQSVGTGRLAAASRHASHPPASPAALCNAPCRPCQRQPTWCWP